MPEEISVTKLSSPPETEHYADNEWPIQPPADIEPYFDDAFIEKVREQLIELYLTNNNNTLDTVSDVVGSELLIHDTITGCPRRKNSTNNHNNGHLDDDEADDREDKEAQTKLPYHVNDVQLLKSNDNWFLRRFLAWRPTTVHEATDAIHKALIWRQKVQLHSWTDAMFPAEFYQVAACFRYFPDREGNPVVIVRLRCNKKDAANHHYFDRLVKNYFVYVIEKIVSTTPNRGFGLIFDCYKAGLSNVDLDMARFIIHALSTCFSGCIVYVCIYELPWLFNQIWKMIRGWLDEEAKSIVKFHTKEDIEELIEPENLPDYMGGPGRKNFRFIPKGVLTVEEMASDLGIKSTKDIHRLNQHFQKLISSTQS